MERAATRSHVHMSVVNMSSLSLSSPSATSEDTLLLGGLLKHDIGTVVLRYMASTPDNIRICRSVSKQCRELVDAHVHSLTANLAALCSPGLLPLRLPNLQRLAFERCSVPHNPSACLTELILKRPHLLANLRELDLSKCSGLEIDVLAHLLKACGSLSSLKLPHAHPSKGAGPCQDVMPLLSTYAPQLTSLSCTAEYITRASVSFLPQLQNLQHLNMEPTRYRLPFLLASIGQLRDLRSLRLGNCLACFETCAVAASLPLLSSLTFYYDETTPASPRDLMPLTHSKTLQELTFGALTCDDELLAVLGRTPVTSLTIESGPFMPTVHGATAVQQQLTQLKLRVNDVSVAALAAVLPVLKQLKNLSVTMWHGVENFAGLAQAIFGLSQLEVLVLQSDYNGLTEQELQNLPTLPQLQYLTLVNHFSDITLGVVLRCTPQLQHLKLSSCGEITDAGLGSAAQICRKLKHVHFELMRHASIGGVTALATAHCMCKVVVEGCRNVSLEDCRRVPQLVNKLGLDVVKLR